MTDLDRARKWFADAPHNPESLAAEFAAVRLEERKTCQAAMLTLARERFQVLPDLMDGIRVAFDAISLRSPEDKDLLSRSGFEPQHAVRYATEWLADQRERQGWKDSDESTYRFRANTLEALLARVAELKRDLHEERQRANDYLAVVEPLRKERAEFRALAERAAKERPCGECVGGFVDCGMQNDPDIPIYCTCIAGALRSFLAGPDGDMR